MSALQLWCAFVVAGVFAVSAGVKFRDPASFRTGVRAFRVLPERAVGPVARVVPPLEGAAAVLVLVPTTRAAGFLLAAAMLTAFAAGMLGVLRRGVAVSCACFGRSTRPVAPRHVVRNAVLTAMCVTGLLAPAGAPADPLTTVLVALLAAVPAVAIVVTLDDLADLFAPLPPPPTGSRHRP